MTLPSASILTSPAAKIFPLYLTPTPFSVLKILIFLPYIEPSSEAEIEIPFSFFTFSSTFSIIFPLFWKITLLSPEIKSIFVLVLSAELIFPLISIALEIKFK